MSTPTNQPQTELEEIRVTKEDNPDLYMELKKVIPNLVAARDTLAELRKKHIAEAKAAVDALTKTFKEIVTREEWGMGAAEDVIRFEQYQIRAKMSSGHEVEASVHSRVKRVE